MADDMPVAKEGNERQHLEKQIEVAAVLYEGTCRFNQLLEDAATVGIIVEVEQRTTESGTVQVQVHPSVVLPYLSNDLPF